MFFFFFCIESTHMNSTPLRGQGPTAIGVFYFSYPAYTRVEFFLKSITLIELICVTEVKKIPAHNQE